MTTSTGTASQKGASARVAAIDLGASSGRVMVAEVSRDRLELYPVRRFANGPVRLPSGLHWDIPQLYAEALAGLREAGGGGPLASVGIDTWAVDYGLMREGRLLGLPYCYRDELRSASGPAAVDAVVPPAELYARNGLQFLPFNTVYQLAAESWLGLADRLLLVPDLLANWLTGAEYAERTNASTTGLLDVHTGRWDTDLCERLGIPTSLLPPIIEPGEEIGVLTSRVAAQTGTPGLHVVAIGSHDTASAVIGVPMSDPTAAAYLSLGTWGLVGLELDAPVVSEAARQANFTNEGGGDGTIRFLTNVMGTWLLSETLRTWECADKLAGLLAAAAEVSDPVPIFDVQDPRFVPPGDVPRRIATWFAEHDLPAPDTSRPIGRAVLVRSIVESLAVAYADALNTAARLADRHIEVLHVVGGGAQNTLLCQAIADRAGIPVEAGPVEATALGNVLVQARAAEVVGPELGDLRDLIRRTQQLRRHEPGARPT